MLFNQTNTCFYSEEKLKLDQQKLIKGKWCPEEDELLKDIVKLNLANWVEIADRFPGRNAKQCRDRWLYHLSPDINKSKFSEEEDSLIISLYWKYGCSCSKIVEALDNGRNESMVRSRLRALLRNQEESFKLAQSKISLFIVIYIMIYF